MNKENKYENNENLIYDEIYLKIYKGDIITSSKGIISQHPITKEWFLIKKFKYFGNGKIEVIGNKESVKVNEIK
jgi:hypothetical protein